MPANARSYRCVLFSRDPEKKGRKRGEKKIERLENDVIYGLDPSAFLFLIKV
jgi:hypothetical protein